MRVFLCLFIFLAFSCSDSISDPIDDCIPVIFDGSKYNASQNFGIDLNNFSIEGTCLKVTLAISGCAEDHPIDMVSDGAIAESLPPQITFDFYDGTPQDCEAIFVVKREFDLSPIKELYDGEIVIFFRSTDASFTYFQ